MLGPDMILHLTNKRDTEKYLNHLKYFTLKQSNILNILQYANKERFMGKQCILDLLLF